MAAYGTPQVTESDLDMLFTGSVVQKWTEEINFEWLFHLLYNLMGVGMIESYNGVLKAALKTDSQTSRGGLRLHKMMKDLSGRPRDGRPNVCCKKTWVFPLRIQFKEGDIWLKVGMINNLLLPAADNVEPGTHRVRWPWEVRVGPRWYRLLVSRERILEGRSMVAPQVNGMWPSEIIVHTPLITFIWQINVWLPPLPLNDYIKYQLSISCQRVRYKRLLFKQRFWCRTEIQHVFNHGGQICLSVPSILLPWGQQPSWLTEAEAAGVLVSMN